ncbi:discoidin domain-containing protein [Rugosimonospora africana]|uniref:Alpha-L-fucosidase n=1 Tax=Rugosimonospora africana TaxID=556532 RepID=A0A8J3QRR1_9ACTN|nr:discoidin domain-containing protein [Rugosimonospora africana]GIH14333.1 alpha-L-fucosidase [Rugosimonospora africana]
MPAALVALVAIVVAMLGLGAHPARADLTNPRQDFLRASTSGLFLHWGMLTSPGYTSCTAWESAITSGGWSADYWVSEAQKLRASYLVLATFHSKLGYGRAWPSSIPGTCSTKRDFLGELITAAHAKGLRVILYMTNDAQWHDLNGHEWMDSAAFSAYAGHTVDLDTQDGFGEYSYDNFLDVMKSHPALDGFWIDNDNQYWLDHDLYEQIYQLHPNMTLSNNNEDTPIMDMISNEQKTGMTPAYDMPQAYYTAQPRLTEADYKLPSTGNWWYDGSNSTVDYALNLGRYIANAGNSVKSLMAETAMVNGKFPSNQANFNNFMDTYLPPIWSSISGDEGGGYMYGGMPGGNFGNGAYGYTTVNKSDANLQYVHVVTKPTSGNSVKLRDSGYVVSSVTNLRTGAAVSFSQGSGYLTISGVSGWDQYDTVFKVMMSGRTGIETGVTATATASASGHAAANLVDGSYLNYWDSNDTTPVSITLDQKSAKKAAYLAINQREDTITQTATSSARINAYKILTSNDNSTWTTVKSGNLPNVRGVQFIDIGATARYVRLEVDSTYASSKQLRVDELWLGTGYAGGGTTPPPETTYQAEASGNTLSGAAVVATCSACSGGAKVRFIGNNSSNYDIVNNVNVSAAGSHQLTIAYEVDGTRTFDLSVNGGATVAVPCTGTDFNSPATTTVTVTLNAGNNTIKFFNNSAYAPDLDAISVS